MCHHTLFMNEKLVSRVSMIVLKMNILWFQLKQAKNSSLKIIIMNLMSFISILIFHL
mgnify:CR=1 FL=1